jgi:hypothetical protein
LCFADILIIDDKMSQFLIGTHENTVVRVEGKKKIGSQDFENVLKGLPHQKV